MNQAQLTIENPVTVASDINFGESAFGTQGRFQSAHRNAKSNPVAIEKYRLKGLPAVVFFWDGKKVHRITDERTRQEIARSME